MHKYIFEVPNAKSLSGNRFPETGFRKPVSRNRFPETGFRKTVSETGNRNLHKTLSEQTFEKSTDLDFFQNRCENTMILIIFPESDFLKKVAHVHSESFAPVFNLG